MVTDVSCVMPSEFEIPESYKLDNTGVLVDCGLVSWNSILVGVFKVSTGVPLLSCMTMKTLNVSSSDRPVIDSTMTWFTSTTLAPAICPTPTEARVVITPLPEQVALMIYAPPASFRLNCTLRPVFVLFQ